MELGDMRIELDEEVPFPEDETYNLIMHFTDTSGDQHFDEVIFVFNDAQYGFHIEEHQSHPPHDQRFCRLDFAGTPITPITINHNHRLYNFNILTQFLPYLANTTFFNGITVN